MPIYLDYARKDGEVVALSIMEENENIHDFLEDTFDNAIEYLIIPGNIVTFQRPVIHIERIFEFYPTLELNPVRERWLDMYTIIARQNDGKGPSLRNMSRATVGEHLQVSKLPSTNILDDQAALEQTMHDRLEVIRQCYLIGERDGILQYWYRQLLEEVEVQFLDSPA